VGNVARDHRPGHIGTTPQDTDSIIAGGRVAGMIADARSRLPWWPHRRVDDNMGRPLVAADPGYFSDAFTAAQITGAVQRSALNGKRQFQDPKTLGGYFIGEDA
jgi:hypothetical protein